MEEVGKKTNFLHLTYLGFRFQGLRARDRFGWVAVWDSGFRGSRT